MSRKSEDVKRWRRRFRGRIVYAMGGKCVNCGYDKCDVALDMHHLDPERKDFTFGAIRGSPKALAALEPELRRCTLLCKNCHGEVHYGQGRWPTISSFNAERFREVLAQSGTRPQGSLAQRQSGELLTHG